MNFTKEYIEKLNKDIDTLLNHFENKGEPKPFLSKINHTMKTERNGVSKLVMLDRYTYKDTEKVTLTEGDFVILTVRDDPKYPARGYGYVTEIKDNKATIKIDEEFHAQTEGKEYLTKDIEAIEKPLELFYEQISMRNAYGLADVEKDELKEEWAKNFYSILAPGDFVPAGRVLYGAGSATDVTYFNCYVMPYPKDSRGGISEHRSVVMEIMSRGGGVGTNGSTLRPKNALARGVNGKSSGSVSWLDDIAKLTHLVEQGGSRRGAQMIMMADWHPDVLEFIISKIQNPNILRHIINTVEDEQIKHLAQDKLKFTPFNQQEKELYEFAASHGDKYAIKKLEEGGAYSVHNPEFLTGANISVAITHEFMKAVESDDFYELRFPDVDNYNKEDMKFYNENWHEIGDVREWPLKAKTYRKIKAKKLWELINIAATYSAEPGIFFFDNANDMTNAQGYGQKAVCTNPCGEQPLSPYSVCNLAAINLANHTKNGRVDWDKLARTVSIGIRMQDNVISATPYFLEENTKQALGERRIGMGVMGLHDLLIKCQIKYGSEESNKLVDELFKFIATGAYIASVNLAREKGSFPFLEDGPYEDEGEFVSSEEKRLNFINSGFMKKMPEVIREGVLKYGIRNSHLLTVAPTGSTGTMMNVSTGLEPYFSFTYFRSGRLGKFIEVNADILQEWKNANPNKDIPEYFISSMELSPEAHADTQCIIQNWIDSSISKTVNAPKGYTVEQVQSVYERLHKGGAKGGTVYVDGSRDSQVLSLTNEENNLEETSVRLEDNNNVEEDKSAEKYGTEVGDTCIICRVGTVIDAGGCNTCNNCNAQLKCGL
jgi:ribonucleoside-diphosphate reductase alpha chain